MWLFQLKRKTQRFTSSAEYHSRHIYKDTGRKIGNYDCNISFLFCLYKMLHLGTVTTGFEHGNVTTEKNQF